MPATDGIHDHAAVRRDALKTLQTYGISVKRVVFVDSEGDRDEIGYVAKSGEARLALVRSLPFGTGHKLAVSTVTGWPIA